MKERPILFSGEMVRAILDGRKTQTRRIIKPQPDSEPEILLHSKDFLIGGEHQGKLSVWKCPYGQVGERLWVRETWMEFEEDHRISDSKLARFAYRASTTHDGEEIRKEYVKCGRPYNWRPSIHMPRLASRITLEITGVKVDRLQDISNEDAIAEGVEVDGIGRPYGPMRSQQRAFKILWNSINGDNAWNLNPWVWVVSFKRIES